MIDDCRITINPESPKFAVLSILSSITAKHAVLLPRSRQHCYDFLICYSPSEMNDHHL